MCMTWLTYVRDMTISCAWRDSHSYVWRDWFICITWLIEMCDMTHSYVRHDSFICTTWLIHMHNMTQSYVRHDSFICAQWLIHVHDMTHLLACHDSLRCATWLIHMCDMTHSFIRHNSLIASASYQWVMANTYSYMLQPTHTHYQTGDNRMPVRMNMNELQCVAAYCSVLQSAHTLPDTRQENSSLYEYKWIAHCNTLQHTATHCNTLQHTATHCNTMNCSALQCVAVCCIMLQSTHTLPDGQQQNASSYEYEWVAVCCSVVQCVAVHTHTLPTHTLPDGRQQNASSWHCPTARVG